MITVTILYNYRNVSMCMNVIGDLFSMLKVYETCLSERRTKVQIKRTLNCFWQKI